MNLWWRSRRILGFVLIGCIVVSTSGCSKWLANFSLKQATKRVEEARSHDAERFARDLLDQTQDLINATTGQINGEDYANARTSGKDAATRAKELLETTKRERTNWLKSEANRWLAILRTNNSTAINPPLHQKVEDSNADGQEAADEQKWDRAIESFANAVDNSQFLLELLKSDAEQGLKEVAELKDSFIAEGSQEHNPEAVF